MAKPATRAGYSDELTRDCERMLVTLLRGLGPWKNQSDDDEAQELLASAETDSTS
jgi:hypothetical protein